MHTVDEQTLTRMVMAQMTRSSEARVNELSQSLVRHLHEFVREVRLTRSEWENAISFMTKAGQVSDEKRREFILLSDVLGVSILIDAINRSAGSETTETTILGPFYLDSPPELELGADISGGLVGDDLVVTGAIRSAAGNLIPNATIDVWHSDDEGLYDVQHNDLIAMRARFTADGDGRYRFRSIKPAPYPIPHDGPTGQLLSAQGRHPWRPAHVHFMVSAPGFERVVTQIFVAGSPYLDSDVVFGVKDDLIQDFVEHPPGVAPDGQAATKKYFHLNYDFELQPAMVAAVA